MMADEMRGLLIRFAAIRALPRRNWPEDQNRFCKVSPELDTPLPSDARPDDLMRLAVAYGLAGRDIVGKRFAEIAFHKAERMRRVQARAFRHYRRK